MKKSDFTPNYISHGYNITKVEVLCPNKVLRFTFNDKTNIKTICTENDEFDFRFAFFIAFAKKLYKKNQLCAKLFFCDNIYIGILKSFYNPKEKELFNNIFEIFILFNS